MQGAGRATRGGDPHRQRSIGEDRPAVTDVVMQGMSGPEWARSISALRAGLVTVFMTGYAENDTLRAALQGVAWKYVQKPFTVGSLLAQVGEALASRWRGPDRLRDPQFSSP